MIARLIESRGMPQKSTGFSPLKQLAAVTFAASSLAIITSNFKHHPGVMDRLSTTVDAFSEPLQSELTQVSEILTKGKFSNTNILAQNKSKQPAFPGAEGFAKYTKGGRGGKVIFVDNLNDSGPGSLRSALRASGARTVIFRTSGTISLKSTIQIENPYITIAGQTAPGEGIAIKTNGSFNGGAIKIRTDEVIIRHLRVRPGPTSIDPNSDNNGDAITITKGNNIIIDHCSLSWGVDETLQTWMSPSNITIQRSIISEALHDSTHRKGKHSMGALFGKSSNRVTIYKNLFAHNHDRSPRITGDNSFHGQYQIVNNVIYNWGNSATVFDPSQNGKVKNGRLDSNIIGNFFKAGPDSNTKKPQILLGDGSKVYVKGNIGPHRPNNSMNDWSIIKGSSSLKSNKPFNMPNIPTVSAQKAYSQVLEKVGAYLPKRDAVDRRIVIEVKNRTGTIIDDPSDVGGWPKLAKGKVWRDSDKDGMPNWWERRHGLNTKNASDRNGDADNNGYTNLEEFLNRKD